MSIVLRDYQSTIVSRAREEMKKGNRSLLITAPTGSGKTALTAHMLKSAAQKNMDSWFIVHRRELIKQSVRTFDKVDVFHGVVAASFPMDHRPHVQIASISTLVNRYHKLRKPRLIIWDECHHIAAGTWAAIFKAFPQAFHIGLTATPERLDGRGLGEFFKIMIRGPDVKWLIENKFLSPYKAYAPPGVNFQGLHTRMGDFIKSELTNIIDKPTITGDAIREYRKRADGKRNVVFCVSIEHSRHVVDQFNANGIPALHVDGETDAWERDEAIRKFETGEVKVLSNVDLFGEGFDLPAIECVTLLRPTQSLGLYLQQVGRALRIFPGKEQAIILDHAGNIERHGLPDEHREWTLEGREIKKKDKATEPSVRVCSKCFAAQPSGKPVCLYCGTQFEIKARKINEEDGELREIDPEELSRRRQILKRNQEQGRSQSLQDLIQLGKARGYKKAEAWAKHIFNARQRKKVGL